MSLSKQDISEKIVKQFLMLLYCIFKLLSEHSCVCRSGLNSLGAITCDNKTLIITREADMWIGYENDSNCLIVYPNCPFNHCDNSIINFTLSYHNKQCLYNRSEELCVECVEGFSLTLGSNQFEQ